MPKKRITPPSNVKNKIVVIEESFPTVSETFILDQITGLIDLGFEIENWAFNKLNPAAVHKNIIKYKLDECTKYFNLPSARLHAVPGEWFRKFQELNPSVSIRTSDVFHVHFGTSFINLQPLFMKFPNRVVVSFHGYDASQMINNHGNKIYAFLFERADLITTPSREMKKRLVEAGCNENKIVVHHYGIDLNLFKKKESENNPEIRILTVARLVEKKGILNSLKAFSKLSDKRKIKYKLIGEGPLENEIRTAIRNLNLNNYLEIIPFLPKEKIAEEMSNSDIYL
ncbi:MAG TPA: glycosyltransferase, partial [Ignavibacteriaceae bacterium]|nr:glycosyltransferase [Ignavibacteriaceae bacterium]